MAAVKSKKPINKLKASKANRVSKKMLIPIIAIAAAAGVFFVYKSFASVNSVTSTVSFINKKETGKFISTDGKVCVATSFTDNNNGTLINDSYKWEVQVWDRQGFWARVATSKKYQSNGNRDHECYDGQIYKGNSYRVVFYDANTDYKYSFKGSYFVSGYYRP